MRTGEERKRAGQGQPQEGEDPGTVGSKGGGLPHRSTLEALEPFHNVVICGSANKGSPRASL
jgi:hypothetical protein